MMLHKDIVFGQRSIEALPETGSLSCRMCLEENWMGPRLRVWQLSFTMALPSAGMAGWLGIVPQSQCLMALTVEVHWYANGVAVTMTEDDTSAEAATTEDVAPIMDPDPVLEGDTASVLDNYVIPMKK